MQEFRERLKGIWFYPYTRNKTLNNQWKRNLKTWDRQGSNFNGVVIRLIKDDFPLYAGDLVVTGPCNKYSIMKDMDELKNLLKKFPSNRDVDPGNLEIDTDEFEIILLKKVRPERIVKIIKDRVELKNLR